MHVTYVSKNISLTSGIKNFLASRTEKLSKYSSHQLSKLSVIIDVNSHRKGAAEDAVVELVGDVKGKHIIVRSAGENFYSAFFSAFAKMKSRLIKSRKTRRVQPAIGF